LPQVTCTANFMKFGHVIFEICEQTSIQTRSSQYFAHLLRTKIHVFVITKALNGTYKRVGKWNTF